MEDSFLALLDAPGILRLPLVSSCVSMLNIRLRAFILLGERWTDWGREVLGAAGEWRGQDLVFFSPYEDSLYLPREYALNRMQNSVWNYPAFHSSVPSWTMIILHQKALMFHEQEYNESHAMFYISNTNIEFKVIVLPPLFHHQVVFTHILYTCVTSGI